MITLRMNVDGVTRSLKLLGDSLKPSALAAPLREISKAKQAEVRQRFEQGGPGWAPLSASAIATRARAVKVRVARAQSRAIESIDKRLRRQLTTAIERQSKRGNVRATTIDRRRLEAAVIGKLRRGEELSGSVEERAASRLFSRSLARQKQIADKANKLGKLGKIANSIRAKIDGTSLTLESEVEWSGVHNDGGKAGNNATIPARTFLEWTAEDLDLAAAAFERHMIRAVVD